MSSTSSMENLTLANNDPHCGNHFNRTSIVYFIAVIIMAIPSNIFSLYVAWQHIKQKNELGVYLFNLALSDLIFVGGLALYVVTLWKAFWTDEYDICMTTTYILLTNFYTSEGLLCCIAVDRYLALVHPFKYTFLRRVSTAVIASVVVWVLVICLNIMTLPRKVSYRDEEKLATCSDISFLLSQKSFACGATRFFVGFIIPFLLVVFCTWRTCKAVKSNQATDVRERKHILKLLTMVLVCLSVCFGPIQLMMLILAFLGNCRTPNWVFYVDEICMLISTLNCVADPLLYCFITKTGKANVNQVILFFQVKR
ncbi:uncharacterized protein V6R79_010712 [Siganus canaliculatus]